MTVKVTRGAAVVFDWNPACAVAMVLVEEGASDKWSAHTSEATWSDPAAANLITPPVTYGTVPAGATSSIPAQPLVTGTTYEVILWRVMPSGQPAMIANHPFVR